MERKQIEIQELKNTVAKIKSNVQAYLGDIVGSVPDHRNKVNLTRHNLFAGRRLCLQLVKTQHLWTTIKPSSIKPACAGLPADYRKLSKELVNWKTCQKIQNEAHKAKGMEYRKKQGIDIEDTVRRSNICLIENQERERMGQKQVCYSWLSYSIRQSDNSHRALGRV